MREIIIMGLSGEPKTLPPDATKSEIISAILEVADDQKHKPTTKGETNE